MPDQTALPDWLPLPIRQIAERGQSFSVGVGIPEAEAMFQRLIFDERMKRVWDELDRQRSKAQEIQRTHQAARRTAAFIRDPSVFEDHEKLWQWILESFFQQVLSIAINMPQTMSGSDVRKATQLKQHIIEKHKEWANEFEELGLHWDANSLREFSFGPPYDPNHDESGENTTLEMEDYYRYLDLLITDDALRIERHRTDKHVLGFVIELAKITSRFFGSPLFGTIANITNVRFDRDDMTDLKVRDLLRRSKLQLPVDIRDPGL